MRRGRTAVELIDLSHDVEHGAATYPGLPAPVVTDHLSYVDSRDGYAPATEFLISKIELVGNTGTYLDASRHRYRDGRDLAGLSLERVAWRSDRYFEEHPFLTQAAPEFLVEGGAVLVGIDP